MRATLTEHINFSDPPRRGDEVQVDLRNLSLTGKVILENRTLNAQGDLQSWEEAELLGLQLDHTSGLLEGGGPGWISSVRFTTTAANEPLLPGAPSQGGAPRLVHIQVRFLRAVTANLAAREVDFFEHVRAGYGPVRNWDERIDLDRAELGPETIELDSDRLKLTEMRSGGPGNLAQHELIAEGNVHVWGNAFDARGHRLSYVDAKDWIKLVGDDRDPAVVRSPWYNGNADAREINIYPRAKRVTSEGIRKIEFTPLGISRGIPLRR
jgi:hypothetical protein